MGKTTDLRREIKRVFMPLAEARGFKTITRNSPFFLEFRRRKGDEINIFDIQWEKYGKPRFVVNFGNCPVEGLTIHGKHYPPDEVISGWTPQRGRLQPGKGSGTGSWFRQDKPFIKRILSRDKLYPAKDVVAQLAALFMELENWWETGKTGPHMRIFPEIALPSNPAQPQK
jgi:hypothetical protein